MHRTQRPSNGEVRAEDPALTGHAGLLLTGELAARTHLVARLDRAIDGVGPFKQRWRGSSAGELLVALAEMMSVGGDHLVHLEELREDEAGAELRAVGEVLAPTTAGQLMRRLNARQCQAAVAELAKVGEEVDRQLGLTATAPVTLDLDSSDTEVYGRLKEGAAFNHRGQRSYDSQLATWAERRRISDMSRWLARHLCPGLVGGVATGRRAHEEPVPADHPQRHHRGWVLGPAPDAGAALSLLLSEVTRHPDQHAVAVHDPSACSHGRPLRPRFHGWVGSPLPRGWPHAPTS